MNKTAVIYDKWLHQYGGAEVVACTMMSALHMSGWKVICISGKNVTPEMIKEKTDIDLSGIEFIEIWNDEGELKDIVEGKDLFINLTFMDYSYGFAKRNIYYTHFPTRIRGFLFNAALVFFQTTGLHRLLPIHLRQRIYDRLRAGIFFDVVKRLNSYDAILANSLFTQKWIKKYWGKESIVLYPPVNIHENVTRYALHVTRKNWIASVGRFFTLGHGKKQEILIEAFKKLISENRRLKTDGWQLHLVGGIGQEPSSLQFIDKLKQMAKGYPINFHLNATHQEVEDVLFKSRIYWHAAGYGEIEEKNPLKFEHFGLSAIEAINAGCSPILFDGGGLREIIDQYNLPPNKHLFKTVDDLVNKSMVFVDPINEKTDNNSKSGLFSSETFEKKFLSLISS